MALRWQNAVLLIKNEATPGTAESSLSASTDAVLIENVSLDFDPHLQQTNEVSGSLDGFGPIPGGLSASLGFDIWFKGAGTAGTAPEWGKVLKACGFAELITGTAVPASSEALAAGGSTTTAVLGTSAGTTAQQYRGMPIVFTSAVPGTSFIADYTAGKVATLTDTLGGALIATSNYQIPLNVRYSPASASLPSVTLWLYVDGVLYKLFAGVGEVGLTLNAGQPGKFTFKFNALFTSKTDASVPTGVVYDSTRPPVWKNGVASYNRVLAGQDSLSFNTGNTIQMPGNPNALEGFDAPIITDRNITGQAVFLETLVATRDIMGDLRAGTSRIVHARYGSVAGNRLAVTAPAALATNQSPANNNGLMNVTVPLAYTGKDAGVFITAW